MSGFFEEVKRRKVYRVAVAYVIAAGGIIQLASAAFPAWELPNWSLRLVIVLLLIGFPIALILAWAFDVTAQGIRTTPSVAAPKAHRRRNIIILVATGVLTNLSKIGDLKVISRTSVMPYRGKASNVREIGKALGVATILEGTVRRVGNRVRVSVQLINADSDEHVWAEDYDRDLTDVFAIQTDLAQKIVYTLQAKLSPNEKERLDR